MVWQLRYPEGTKMTRNLPADVETLIREHMATGRYPTEGDLLREALVRLNEDTAVEDEDMVAILEGLEDVNRGEPGMSVEETFRWILERHSSGT
jgi:Arc/MetJ-type ribon-helix-helix transcriptional regulator